MSIQGHGIDLVELDRIRSMLERHGRQFLTRILTAREQELANRHRDPTQFVAGRWAAKEALVKMISTGMRGRIEWTDMEILPDELGQPHVTLTGEFARIAKARGIERVLLSISHTKTTAAASTIGASALR